MFRIFLLSLCCLPLAGVSRDTSHVQAAIDNLYAVTEQRVADPPVFIAPDVSGNTIVWLEERFQPSRELWSFNISSGARTDLGPLTPSRCTEQAVHLDGNQAVIWMSEVDRGLCRAGIIRRDLNTKSDQRIASNTVGVGTVDVSGGQYIYSDIRNGQQGFYLLNAAGQETMLATDRRGSYSGSIEGDFIAWREELPFGQARIVARRISTGQQWTLVDFVPTSEFITDVYSTPVVSQLGAVSWVHQIRGTDSSIYAKVEGAWLTGATPQRFDLWSANSIGDIAMSGNIAVWVESNKLLGYDLTGSPGGMFVISQVVGRKADPAISVIGTTKTVIWRDYRNAGLNSTWENAEIYAATLTPGPAPAPPQTGVPAGVDARIEIVWPQRGSVSTSTRANIAAYLLLPNSLQLPACQWEPAVRLWKAVNNDPSRLVATAFKYVERTEAGTFVPLWAFNDVDVSEAQDPVNKIYFTVTVDDVASESTVWAHGEDARTYFPQPVRPNTVKPLPPPRLFGGLDSQIQIVWPQGGMPVEQAESVNISASMFYRGTHDSPPADYPTTMTLYSALNNDVLRPVGAGVRRVVRDGDLEYPVWDFNNIPVPAARDPVNKYYFTARADDDRDASIWSHGADARTYFPTKDVPTSNCD